MVVMKRLRILSLCVLTLGAASTPAFCQSGSVNWSIAPADKPAPKKKATGQASAATSVDAGKATRLEEGRKKFFEQSSGFDHSTMWDKSDMHMNMGSGGDTKPGLGFGF